MDLKKFVLEGNPVCRKEAVIVGDHFRITMLTTALIRFEYSEDGGFEDRATQMVCNRDFPVQEFTEEMLSIPVMFRDCLPAKNRLPVNISAGSEKSRFPRNAVPETEIC